MRTVFIHTVAFMPVTRVGQFTLTHPNILLGWTTRSIVNIEIKEISSYRKLSIDKENIFHDIFEFFFAIESIISKKKNSVIIPKTERVFYEIWNISNNFQKRSIKFYYQLRTSTFYCFYWFFLLQISEIAIWCGKSDSLKGSRKQRAVTTKKIQIWW